MSLRSLSCYQVPDETVRIARAAFPKGNLYMEMQAELGMLSTNHQFASLFSTMGQPAEDPARLALILGMQTIEGLSDRQTADAVRGRIAWKYALALDLSDPGFDDSVLSEFRSRLVTGQLELLLLDTLLQQLQERGLLRARGKQRTDSTHILAAVRTLNRLGLVIETLRLALNRLAAQHPEWRERYELRAETSRLPKEESKRLALAAQVGADGFQLLAEVFADTTPPEVRAEPAVEVLRQVWLQQYYGPHEPPRWRGEQDIPAPGQLIHSPYAVEARYCTKRGESWVGYKTHYRETCDAKRPNLITNVLTTAATLQDETVLALDWERQVAICPRGKESYSWLPTGEGEGDNGAVQIRFRRKDGTPCASRAQCTKAQVEPRLLYVQARPAYEVLQAARAEQHTEAFRAEYALRSGVESLMSQEVRAFELRKARYIGCARTQLQHILIAVSINIVRLVAWVREPRRTPARVSAFARLATLT